MSYSGFFSVCAWPCNGSAPDPTAPATASTVTDDTDEKDHEPIGTYGPHGEFSVGEYVSVTVSKFFKNVRGTVIKPNMGTPKGQYRVYYHTKADYGHGHDHEGDFPPNAMEKLGELETRIKTLNGELTQDAAIKSGDLQTLRDWNTRINDIAKKN